MQRTIQFQLNEGCEMTFKTVKKNSNDSSVLVLQTVFRLMQYLGADGKPIEITGKCDANTVYAINTFQTKQRAYGVECGTNGKNDSSFGPKCWSILLGE